MFGRIRARNTTFKKKKETGILMCGKGKKIIIFQRTRLEFQGIQG